MLSDRRAVQRGYSLGELLVVTFIIGLMSLVTIPAFMNYTRASRLKTSLRNVTGAIRWARAQAVTKNEYAIVSFDPAAKGINTSGQYTIWEGTPSAANTSDMTLVTWKQVGLTRRIETGCYFENDAVAGAPVADLFDGTTWATADGKPDILFKPDGTISFGPQTLLLKSDFNIQTNQYSITMTTAVSIVTRGTHN